MIQNFSVYYHLHSWKKKKRDTLSVHLKMNRTIKMWLQYYRHKEKTELFKVKKLEGKIDIKCSTFYIKNI